MTPTEAAALALLGLRDRRLLAALVRAANGRAHADDLEALPPRLPDDSLIGWACRCRALDGGRDAARETAAQLTHEATAQLTRAATLGVIAVPLGDDRYPALLAAIPDPPALVWLRGTPAVLTDPAVAIVGSRAATPYALAMAERLAADLASAGLVIVSGLARGVDSSAHAAALAARGRTVGVLGCGIDRVYPPEHRDLAIAMQENGAVVSEFPPGVPPLPHHFPLRNRIISGLSTAIVVVEAPEKSGALITAACALEQGRDVLVVPGPASGRNRGGHLLIRDGAKIVESGEDVLRELGALLCADRAHGPAAAGDLPDGPDFTVDEVAARTGEPPGVVLARLLDLELAGRIRRVGGGRFVRLGGRDGPRAGSLMAGEAGSGPVLP